MFAHLTAEQKQLLWRLKRKQLPGALLEIVALILLSGILEGSPSIDSCEFFAGEKAVTLGLLARNYRAASFEYKDDEEYENILSPSGYIYALILILMTKPGGVCWFQEWGSITQGYAHGSFLSSSGHASAPCTSPAICTRLHGYEIVLHSCGIVLHGSG